MLYKTQDIFFYMSNHENINLEKLSTDIHKLDVSHHLQIASILKNDPQVKLNENNNGLMINLSLVSENTIEAINKYVEFVSEQEQQIQTVQCETEKLKTQLTSEN